MKLTIITLLLGSIVPSTFYKCGDVGGVYIPEVNTAYVCELNDGNTNFYRYHEEGHYYWYKVLTQPQRNEYTKAYNKAYIKGINYFYREYSMGDVEEDFADNFALIKTNEKYNIRIKQRTNLIKKWIRN